MGLRFAPLDFKGLERVEVGGASLVKMVMGRLDKRKEHDLMALPADRQSAWHLRPTFFRRGGLQRVHL